MIKFFRFIRQRLVSQNKLGKYLVYAIGEIVLVVIGILIAIQINNWNEEKKNNRIETVTLRSLKEDLLSSQAQLTEKISNTQERV
jgi:hypothetical protein